MKIAKRLCQCERQLKLRRVLIAIVMVNRMKRLAEQARNPDEQQQIENEFIHVVHEDNYRSSKIITNIKLQADLKLKVQSILGYNLQFQGQFIPMLQ